MTDAPKLTLTDEQVQRIWEIGGYGKDEFKDELRVMGLIAPEPVDPLDDALKAEVRRIFADEAELMGRSIGGPSGGPERCRWIGEGKGDDYYEARIALAAIKRGMELAQPTLTVDRLRVALRGQAWFCTESQLTNIHAALTGQKP